METTTLLGVRYAALLEEDSYPHVYSMDGEISAHRRLIESPLVQKPFPASLMAVGHCKKRPESVCR